MKTTNSFFELFLILLLCITGCNTTNNSTQKTLQKQGLPIIDLAKAIETDGNTHQLSDFVEDIEYIRPEYPKSVVGFIYGMSINDNYLLLNVPNKLLCYNRKGKFLREIARKGQGPKEHLGIRSSALYNDIVAINSNYKRKILWYNTKGEYLKQQPTLDAFYKINILDTNRVACFMHHGILMNQSKELFIAGIFNNKGDTIKIKQAIPYYSKGIASSPEVWKYKDTLRVLTCLNDTIYSVTKNNITPKYVLNLGKYKVSKEAFADVRILDKERSKYIPNSPSLGETEQYVLISFPYDKKQWFVLYNKKTGKITSWYNKAESINKYGFIEGGELKNDVDGGIGLSVLSFSNGYLYRNIQPEDLKAKFNENKNKVKVKYPDKQQKLEQLINSLKDDENPVIMIYKLKK